MAMLGSKARNNNRKYKDSFTVLFYSFSLSQVARQDGFVKTS